MLVRRAEAVVARLADDEARDVVVVVVPVPARGLHPRERIAVHVERPASDARAAHRRARRAREAAVLRERLGELGRVEAARERRDRGDERGGDRVVRQPRESALVTRLDYA